MRLPDEPGSPVPPPGQPTRDLLLAQALDACISAERRLPGSSQEIIARQPAWARGELRRLVGLAGSLDAATSNAIMSSEFRVAARARLMQRIGGNAGPPVTPDGFVDGATPAESKLTRPPSVAPLSMVSSSSASSHGAPESLPTRARRKSVWVWRVVTGTVAAVLAVAATLTASASALPGEPLYGLKEAQEELAVRLAADDQQRALALLQQANARLNETARLLQLGRTLDATATTLRYDQVVERATSSYVGAADDTRASAPAAVHMAASLSQDQDQLQALLQSAPEPARADLREALVTTERGRALVADPRPVESARGRSDRAEAALAAAVPTVAVADEPSPTLVPTAPAESPTAVPTRRPAVVPPTPTPAAILADEQDAAADAETTPVVAQVGEPEGSDGTHGSGPGEADSESDGQVARPANPGSQAPGSNRRPDVAPVSPTVVAHDEPQDTPDNSFERQARSTSGGDNHSQLDDRPDRAALTNGRLAAAPLGNVEGHGTSGNQGQADRSGRGQDVPQTAVAHPLQAPAAGSDGRSSSGARSNGGEEGGGAPARTAPAQVAALPDRTATVSTTASASATSTSSSAITTSTSSSTSTSSNNALSSTTSGVSSASTSGRSGHYNFGGDVRASPMPQVTATKTPSTAASANSPAPAAPAVSTSRRGSDGDSARSDDGQKSWTTAYPNNWAPRNPGGSDRYPGDGAR